MEKATRTSELPDLYDQATAIIARMQLGDILTRVPDDWTSPETIEDKTFLLRREDTANSAIAIDTRLQQKGLGVQPDITSLRLDLLGHASRIYAQLSLPYQAVDCQVRIEEVLCGLSDEQRTILQYPRFTDRVSKLFEEAQPGTKKPRNLLSRLGSKVLGRQS